jgi:hypothetical protein
MERLMLDFAHLDRGLGAAKAAKWHLARTGKTSLGYDLWTTEDSETLRRLYPDYQAAMKALPNRTLEALKKHAYEMGIVHRNHVWTGAAITRMRKLAAAGARRKEKGNHRGLCPAE